MNNNDEDLSLVNLFKEQKFSEAIENTIADIISGKKSTIEEFILFIKNSEITTKNKFVDSIVSLLKEKENVKEIISPIVDLITIIFENDMLSMTNELIEKIHLPYIQTKSYISIAILLEKAKNRSESMNYIKKAINSINNIHIISEKAELQTPIASLMAEQGNYEDSLTILKSIQLDGEKGYCSRRVLNFIIDEKNKETKIDLLKRLAEITSKIKDDKIKSDCFVSITRAMINSNMVYEALALARQIQDEKAKISTLGVIIDLMTKSGLNWEAKEIVGEVKEAVSHIKDDDKDRSEALSEVINAQIKVDMVDEAISISEEVQDSGWKAMNITLIAEAMVKNDLPEKALPLLEKSIALVENLDNSGSKSTVLSSVFEVISSIDNLDEEHLKSIFNMVMKILKGINDPSVIYTVIGYIYNIGILSQYENFKKDMLEFTKTIKDEKIKNHILTMISKG